jgi:hypothetical protein
VTVVIIVPLGCLTVSYLLCYYLYTVRLGVIYYLRYYLYDTTEVWKPVTTVGTCGPMVGMSVVGAFGRCAESDVICVVCSFVVSAPPTMFV